MFGPDGFHPSPTGYKACAGAMLPSVAEAVGVLPADVDETEPLRGEGVYALSEAAAEAAQHTGTEVSADPADTSRGRGWVLLRRRRRHAIPEVGDVEQSGEQPEDKSGVIVDGVHSGEPGQACGKGLSGDAR